jgi:hypothetical protein
MLRPQDSDTRERKSLNGLWQFRLDPEGEGQSAEWFSRPRRGPEAVAHVVANFHRLLLRIQWVSDSATSAAASSRESPTSVSAALPGWIRPLAASARPRSSVSGRACAYRSCMDRWKRASAAASAGISRISSPSR